MAEDHPTGGDPPTKANPATDDPLRSWLDPTKFMLYPVDKAGYLDFSAPLPQAPPAFSDVCEIAADPGPSSEDAPVIQEIDRIIARLDTEIPAAQKTMDALLSRLRSTRIVA